MYVYHNVVFDENGNAIGHNATQADCSGGSVFSEVHVKLPSGYQGNASNSGTSFTEAVAPSPMFAEMGFGDIFGFNSITYNCWEPDYYDFDDPFPLPIRVGISGPTMVPMVASGVQGPDSIQLTASPTPTGGSFAWTATSGGSYVNILNPTSQTAIIKGVAAGTAAIRVTYTYNNQSTSSSRTIRVQLPARLGVLSDTSSMQDYLCGGTPYFCGVRRYIQYDVRESDGTVIAVSMPVYETFNPISNTCYDVPNKPDESSGFTLADGKFPSVDQLGMKSSFCLPVDANGVPQGSCSLIVDQSWFANDFRVGFNRVQYACRSITLSPMQ
jgi:hypothetical protein